MKILITGVNGFLGRHLVNYLSESKNYQIIATAKSGLKGILPNNVAYQGLDITNKQEVLQTITFHQPQIIIHAAAMSKPDECEEFNEKALLTNTTAVDYFVKACLQHNCYLIFTSSDFIFGNDGEVAEDAAPNPLSYYGQTKLWAEELIKKQMQQYSIIRPVFMYGKQLPAVRGSFLHWVRDCLQQGSAIKVVNDQLRKPCLVLDICEAIKIIIEEKHFGTFNLSGDEVLTPYQMAIKVAKHFKYDENLVTPVTNTTFKEKALRATNSLPSNAKAKQVLQFAPTSFLKDGMLKTFGE